jgi:hypothetical protein
VALELKTVGSADEIRDGIAKFNDLAAKWDYARKLLRTTTYWVYDSGDEVFGLSKFVGFIGLDAATYEAAQSGDFKGARFDGHVSRRAIEQTLSGEFRDDDELSEKLVTWAGELVDDAIFEAIDCSKWRSLSCRSASRHRHAD